MDQTEYWQVTCRPLLTLRFRWWPRFGLVRALGRDLGDTNSSGAYGRAASNGRPEQLPSFSAVTAPMETNPKALSCHFAMVDPLVVLGPPGLGLGVRIRRRKGRLEVVLVAQVGQRRRRCRRARREPNGSGRIWPLPRPAVAISIRQVCFAVLGLGVCNVVCGEGWIALEVRA